MLSSLSNTFFPICSFIISLFLFCLLKLRKSVKNKETKIYSILIYLELLESAMYVLITFLVDLVYDGTGTIFYMYYNKALGSLYVILMSVLAYYLVVISNIKEKYNSLILKILSLIDVVVIFVVFLLPINVSYDPTYHLSNSYGSAINMVYVACLAYLIFMLVIIFANYKKTNLRTKFIPCYVLLLLIAISLFIRLVDPFFNVTSNIFSFVLLIMYFTIENPDIKMIEALNQARLEAERANHAKSDFLSSMSHEIRTPLNAIVGFSDCILEEDNLEDVKNDAKDIKLASENLLEIVNGILDISKIEANKMEIIESNYKPLEIFNNVSKLVRPRIGEKPIEFINKFAPDLPYQLYGDVGKLRQILTNILTNACKYTEAGSITFYVHSVNENDVCHLVMAVEDTGRGIKPDQIDKLFTKFQRLEEDRNTTLEGTGLGLAITKSMVEMLGGKIVVQSKYGEGSKFTIYLNQKIVNQVRPVDAAATTTLPVINKEMLNLANKRVLVVDDNKINIKVALKLLANYGINADSVESGAACLEIVNNAPKYDLILLDDMMPKMSGVETLKKLKEDPSFSTPVVALTANAISGMKEKYLADGFDDYLSKPIDKNELLRVLNEFLNK